ncbi:hypothetical protein RN001_007336 [Aquatica leii]|uniref:Uncharacterized protein n=1 Tax=Aquatica leii TaxID=1421715 RepID=A0AAN7P2P8_9COLE|nr:hypothetical protein RN001_007336 [Aquatica leii]
MSEKTIICRICLLEIVKTEQYYFLNNDNELKLQSKLLDLLPEIVSIQLTEFKRLTLACLQELNITTNPIACNKCITTIDEIYEFKQLCIQTELIIRNLRQQGAIKEELLHNNIKVELSDLQIISNDCLEINTDVPVYIEEPSKTELYYCHKCDFNTNTKTSLIRHLYHKNLKAHICEDAVEKPYIFDSNKTLLTKHTDEKQFKCSICDYCSDRMEQLKSHMCKHTGEKPFKCNICDYCSIYNSNLKIHMRNHTTEKVFKCNICDYCSNRMDQLKSHMCKHTGKKPFKCNICDYCSIYNSNLKTHMRKHTNEKPFKCNICDYCSSRMDQLKSHM